MIEIVPYNPEWPALFEVEKSALQAEVLALPAGLLARYFHCTDRMMEFGPDLGMPHTKAMSAGLFELRLKSREEDRQDTAKRIGTCTQADEGMERC